MGSTPYFSAGGKLPPAIPTSIFRFFQKRFNHSLFRPPTPEITFQIGKAVGYTQPLVAIGAPCEFQSAASLVFRMGVREDVDRIGLIIYFSTAAQTDWPAANEAIARDNKVFFMVYALLSCFFYNVGTTFLMVPSGLNSIRSIHTSRCTPGPFSRSIKFLLIR